MIHKAVKTWIFQNLWALFIGALSFTLSFSFLNFRVNALENSLKDRPLLIERFVTTEQQVKDMKEDLSEIKQDVKDIKSYLIKNGH